MTSKTFRIACIPGDGIGKEVIPAGQEVLQALAASQPGLAFEFTSYGWGGDWYRAHGEMMPADGLAQLRDKDAILFGSAGDPHIPDHITLWGLRLKICQGFDQYANVRPTRILPGIDAPLKRCAPQDLDWVIVRENSEGEYAGVGGRAHQGHPIEVATDLSVMTRAGVERIMRFAFRLAQSRPRKLLTVITKSNAQRHAMVMWDEIALQISQEFPDVKWDKELVDAATARMVNRPATLDTIVATNLHADILSDLAAALAGSLGIAFGDDGEQLAGARLGQAEGKTHDALHPGAGHHAQVGGHLDGVALVGTATHAGVFTFGVFAHDDPVQVFGRAALEGCINARQDARGPHVGVLVKPLANLQAQAPERDVVGDVRVARRAEQDGVLAAQLRQAISGHHLAMGAVPVAAPAVAGEFKRQAGL